MKPMSALLRYMLLLSLVLWIGGIVFFSFIASPSIFKTLPREQAGLVVGDIFPTYHLLGYVSCIIALACLFGLRQLGPVQSIRTAMIFLVLMGGIQVTMGTVIGPKVIQARGAVKSTAPGPEKDRLEKKFRGLHGVSMILNLVLLILGLILLYWLALRLQL
jgi:uncharacterized membrane protein